MHLAVVGTQWGDEGKGKFADYYADRADVVARYQGGPHTGHSVVVDGQRIKFFQVPAGVARRKRCVIGNGCVVEPIALCREIAVLEALGWTVDLRIATTAHVIFPYHRAQDAAMEAWRSGAPGEGQLGSTRMGVGPCREDKIARIGLRMADLLDRAAVHARLDRLVPLKRRMVAAASPETADDPQFPWDAKAMADAYAAAGAELAERLTNASRYLGALHAEGRTILFEGAQSVGLDIEHGTYPFCSSGHSAAGGVAVGTGLPASLPVSVCGVVKAYVTRVGGGLMPTEINGPDADIIAEKGHEYGTVTGRRRRIGHLDLPLLRRSMRVDGVRSICLSCIDTLADLDGIQIATHYDLDGRQIEEYPDTHSEACRAVPQYRRFAGWPAFDPEAAVADGWMALPQGARDYISFVSNALGVDIAAVGVGPDRAQTLHLSDPY